MSSENQNKITLNKDDIRRYADRVRTGFLDMFGVSDVSIKTILDHYENLASESISVEHGDALIHVYISTQDVESFMSELWIGVKKWGGYVCVLHHHIDGVRIGYTEPFNIDTTDGMIDHSDITNNIISFWADNKIGRRLAMRNVHRSLTLRMDDYVENDTFFIEKTNLLFNFKARTFVPELGEVFGTVKIVYADANTEAELRLYHIRNGNNRGAEHEFAYDYVGRSTTGDVEPVTSKKIPFTDINTVKIASTSDEFMYWLKNNVGGSEDGLDEHVGQTEVNDFIESLKHSLTMEDNDKATKDIRGVIGELVDSFADVPEDLREMAHENLLDNVLGIRDSIKTLCNNNNNTKPDERGKLMTTFKDIYALSVEQHGNVEMHCTSLFELVAQSILREPLLEYGGNYDRVTIDLTRLAKGVNIEAGRLKLADIRFGSELSKNDNKLTIYWDNLTLYNKDEMFTFDEPDTLSVEMVVHAYRYREALNERIPESEKLVFFNAIRGAQTYGLTNTSIDTSAWKVVSMSDLIDWVALQGFNVDMPSIMDKKLEISWM